MRDVEKQARDATTNYLEKAGWSVADVSSGQGVPKKSRILITRDNKSSKCLVKFSTNGRISFSRANTGSYALLDENDFVIHVQPSNDYKSLRATMFKSCDVKFAFQENYNELLAKGVTHLPQWLNPEFQLGMRFVGSGYGEKKLWSVDIDVSGNEIEYSDNDFPSEPALSLVSLSLLDEVKQLISMKTGVGADEIELEIKLRA